MGRDWTFNAYSMPETEKRRPVKAGVKIGPAEARFLYLKN